MIGIEFDENTEWGQLTVLELKLLIHLALQQFDEAHELVGAFLQYNDNTVERGLFYQALNAVLGSVDGSVRFFGLTPTSMQLEGLDRHRRLIDSYKKMHVARANGAATAS